MQYREMSLAVSWVGIFNARPHDCAVAIPMTRAATIRRASGRAVVAGLAPAAVGIGVESMRAVLTIEGFEAGGWINAGGSVR